MRRRNNGYEILTAFLFFALVFIFTFVMLTGFNGGCTDSVIVVRETSRPTAEVQYAKAIVVKKPVVYDDVTEAWFESEPEDERGGSDWFTDREVDIVAAVIFHEAGYGCTDRHQELVGAVVYNRMLHAEFPDTIAEVVMQRGQYQGANISDASTYMTSAMEADSWEHCREVAVKALRGEVDCPSDVVFQANFVQGHGIYEYGYTSYSVTYFCYI